MSSNTSTAVRKKRASVKAAVNTNRRRQRRRRRHLGCAALSVAIFWIFWQTRQQWAADMRFWKAMGDVGFVLLWATVLIGPLAKLWKPARALLPWRRQLGIWFALASSLHALLIFNGWARWSVSRFLGYEFIPQLGREARWEPGFGLANILGLTALFVGLLLAATSSDRAMKALRSSAWKFLHNGVYFVFYVGSIHALYFLFFHYTVSFHKNVPPPDWFRFWFLGMVSIVAALHVAAFVKTVRASQPEAIATA